MNPGFVPSAAHPYLDGPFPRAFAHRGWHIDDLAGMENSLSAFRRAAAEGYSYMETDVRATSDGVPVVIHDASLDRTTDASGRVARQPWSRVSSAKIRGREPVCRLADLLEELPDSRFNIDVKANTALTPVIQLLGRMNAWHRVCLAAFSDARLARMRGAVGDRLLTSMGPVSVLGLRLRSLVRWLPLLPVRGQVAQVPVRRHGIKIVDPALLRYAHDRGAEVHVWTVDRAEQMVELLDLGVDGLITDRPDTLRSVLAERGTWPATQ